MVAGSICSDRDRTSYLSRIETAEVPLIPSALYRFLANGCDHFGHHLVGMAMNQYQNKAPFSWAKAVVPPEENQFTPHSWLTAEVPQLMASIWIGNSPNAIHKLKESIRAAQQCNWWIERCATADHPSCSRHRIDFEEGTSQEIVSSIMVGRRFGHGTDRSATFELAHVNLFVRRTSISDCDDKRPPTVFE